ncbi:MAG TPA: DUF1501 domain-containing protein [Blastocatellia bacterium]|nr:DUF1501 domain-containing protein [Blastocatellia bacterium]
MKQINTKSVFSRRQIVQSLLGGSLLLPGLLTELLAPNDPQSAIRNPQSDNPLAPRSPHFAPRTKRVIFLFSTGGVSQVDTFDPKPKLVAMAERKGLGAINRPLLRPLWDFKPNARCGTEISDLFPHLREVMDDVCLIRSMKCDHNEHFQATLGMHCGSITFKRPSMGAWVSYGLGTENQNLPSFIVLAPYLPYAGSQVWDSDFLPAVHQGTRVIPAAEPVQNLTRRSPSEKIQQRELSLLDELNRQHLRTRATESTLAARLKSFETAFGMQREMPEVLDLSKETDATLKLYGLERGSTQGFAWQCLVARRLAERGVRFIELIDTGSSNNWDGHSNLKGYEKLARNIDQPIAGLLRDLKSRGMLDDTLVVWTTEYGRTPWIDQPDGRGHHNFVFSSWLAGGGAKPGIVYGQSDEFGDQVAENEVHVHDFHATILHLLGFDHTRLTYRHGGRDYRLTDVHGNVVKGLLA